MSEPSRERRRLLRVGALLLGLLLSLGVVAGFERHLREVEASLPVEWLPDEPGRKYGLRPSPSTNDAGFRGGDVSLEKPQGVRRVVVLGDSVTFGNGVRANESWPVLAQQAMEPMRPRTELINLGVFSYDIRQITATLRHRGWGYDPDVVVYAAYVNDHEPTDMLQLQGQMVFIGDSLPKGTVRFGDAAWLALSRRSAIARRLLGGWVARIPGGARPKARAGDVSYLRAGLEELVEEVRSHDVPFFVYNLVPHPLAGGPDCEPPPMEPDYCDHAGRLVRFYQEVFDEQGVTWASALPYLRGSGERSFYLDVNTTQWDVHHPTVEGHGYFAAGFVDVWSRWQRGEDLPRIDDVIEVTPIPSRLPKQGPKAGRGRKGKRPPKHKGEARPGAAPQERAP